MGGPQITFGIDTHFDMIAHAISITPIPFRLRNANNDGDRSALGELRRDIRCREVIDAGARAIRWSAPKAQSVGRGVALYEYPAGTWGKSTVSLTVKPDG